MFKGISYFNAAAFLAGGSLGLIVAGLLKMFMDKHPIVYEDPLEEMLK